MLVQYRGVPFDWRKRVATIGLNTLDPVGSRDHGGVNRVEADLRDLDLRRFDLTGGSERIQLELGRPRGEVPILHPRWGQDDPGSSDRRASPSGVRIKGGVGQVEVDRRVLRLQERGGLGPDARLVGHCRPVRDRG